MNTLLKALAVTVMVGSLSAGAAGSALAATSATSASEAPDGGALVGTTEHTNAVSFTNTNPNGTTNTDIGAVSYSFDGHYSITEGQPWGGVPDTNGVGSLVIEAGAGRKASEPVAEWFTSNAGDYIGENSFSSSPSELNFAFSGTLTVNGDSYPIVLAQGSNDEGNNWWVGGPGWIGSGISLTSPDGKYEILDQYDSGVSQPDNSFSILPV